ncbi:hypothetical protein SAMN05660742_12721 [Propionispira arboris]|uniref:Uncharacterized protein n=1 Tax=Propionispira arboris TaxID=84035 RepID=A0A1H7CZ07_9FIRM|nr:hypothetical protein SAMN05660742_12721 [Propionispira arboris]
MAHYKLHEKGTIQEDLANEEVLFNGCNFIVMQIEKAIRKLIEFKEVLL